MVPHVWYLNAHIAAMEYCRTLEDIRQITTNSRYLSDLHHKKKKKNPDITTVSNILNSQTNYSQDFYQSRIWVESIQQSTRLVY